MNANLTDITLVVDRSGSMEEIRTDAEGGVNSFIADQAKEPGEARLTLVQFDTHYEFLQRGVPISQVPKYQLIPRGGTALLDAVGRAINETGERLASIPEEDRPGLVIFVVMTDGEENSSKEFSKARIKEMIQHQQEFYNWHFTFLGANQDAFAEAGGMGIDATGVAVFSPHRIAGTYKALGAKVSRMRTQQREGETVVNAFTETERKEMIEFSKSEMSEHGKFETLIERAWDIFDRAANAGGGVVVRPSVPVLFFGDSAAYFASSLKVITVGLNPSKKEFDGSDPFHRFPRARNIDKGTGSTDEYLQALNEYFKTDPLRNWFNCYEPLLEGLGVSYYPGADGAALHTDICSPVATDPTWNRLPPTVKRALSKVGQELWHDLVRELEPEVIVVSVAKHYATGIQFPVMGAPRILYSIDRTNRYVVTIEDIEVMPGRRSRLVKGMAARKPFGPVNDVHKRRIGEAVRETLAT
jgi:hypothetical protein